MIASGANRVDEKKLRAILGEAVEKPDADIWAAAGTPNAVFKLAPDELLAMTGGRVADVK